MVSDQLVDLGWYVFNGIVHTSVIEDTALTFDFDFRGFSNPDQTEDIQGK